MLGNHYNITILYHSIFLKGVVVFIGVDYGK